MANFTTEQLRNIVLIGHGSSGKTTLAEAMLFDTGVLSRRGRVEDGTTTADWDEEAIRRKQSVAASVVACEYKGVKLNILDTPGFLDFAGEAKGAVSVADAGLVLMDSVSGVEVGTELGWGYLDERQLPPRCLSTRWIARTRSSSASWGCCARSSAARLCRSSCRSVRVRSSRAWSM